MKKRNSSAKLLALLAVFGLTVALCACGAKPEESPAPDPNAAADSSINVENAQYWWDVLQTYRYNEDVEHLMLVRYTGGCSAIVKYYEKNVDENNTWSLVFEEEDAYVGKYGIDKTKEGDAKTPTGDFGILYAFGLRDNPGTALEYIDVTPTTYACDEDCEYYNTIIDIDETGTIARARICTASLPSTTTVWPPTITQIVLPVSALPSLSTARAKSPSPAAALPFPRKICAPS